VLEAAHEGLDVEDVADLAASGDIAHREPVAIPPAALVHGDRPLVVARCCDDRVGVVTTQAHRLLDHDVFARMQQLEGELGVEDRRRGDDGDVDRGIGRK
jgi:hypothetical protein